MTPPGPNNHIQPSYTERNHTHHTHEKHEKIDKNNHTSSDKKRPRDSNQRASGSEIFSLTLCGGAPPNAQRCPAAAHSHPSRQAVCTCVLALPWPSRIVCVRFPSVSIANSNCESAARRVQSAALKAPKALWANTSISQRIWTRAGFVVGGSYVNRVTRALLFSSDRFVVNV